MAQSAPSPVRLNVTVIVSGNEENARRDRQCLKQLKASMIQSFTSGSEAIDFLGVQDVDLVVLDTALSDMDGLKFLRLMRLNMNLKDTPVVMVTQEGQKDRVLEAIAAGVDGYVLRPYSLETFQRHMLRALKVDKLVEIETAQLQEGKRLLAAGHFEDAIEAFEELVSEDNQAQKYYDMGCKYLMKQKYGQAILSFKKAVKINELFAEAYKGLAEAYKGKGDLEGYKTYLQRAAETFAHFNRLEETKELFIEVLKYDAASPNPFNSLGVRLRKAGDLPGALHAYRQALELTPDDENIHFNMAKAMHFMGDAKGAQDSLLKALWINPNFTEGLKLHLKIFNREFKAPKGAGMTGGPPSTGTLDSMQDI
ncbi:Chemotaxis protein CheY [Fundidesulfovibrio magnetotacticus]|uniref:Chemotaxis protein CheY n=1 Tax=Fundidesulfovibrio magnetotacticus TaxID=2730080 RepID=A0A6V8LS30_9BACT|nr:tetratricopeptide repeat protein [Fundidesulfovibrio magnetotacticus]GFK92596.1 Chemotaxis protein CheY [Fundidesulfovibrio magnetotacticus]